VVTRRPTGPRREDLPPRFGEVLGEMADEVAGDCPAQFCCSTQCQTQ
jgi:hypothetical protein